MSVGELVGQRSGARWPSAPASRFARLRAMTLAGWKPWLFDTLSMGRSDEQAVFDTYVRANSVLPAPGEAGTNQLFRLRR
jgi:hypothetical protein